MAKNSRKFDDEYGYDNYDDRGYHEELKQRRKMKRMKNSLRSRDINTLMHELEEDEEY